MLKRRTRTPSPKALVLNPKVGGRRLGSVAELVCSDAVVLPSAQPLMADMPVDKPSPSDIKRNLTPREARQLVELQYHEQLRQYQRWLLALAEAVRERRRAEEAPHAQQTNEVTRRPVLHCY